MISAIVVGVLHYLDPTVEAGDGSRVRSRAMRRTVERLRPYLTSVEMRRRLLAEIGVERVDPRFPLARAYVLRDLLAAARSGALARLAEEHPRQHRAIVLRFGLNEGGTVYRKLEDVGQMMDGITRERVRQLEEKALAVLRIGTEDTAT